LPDTGDRFDADKENYQIRIFSREILFSRNKLAFGINAPENVKAVKPTIL